MTNLTEQWKKGELPCGWYYIKIADIVFIDFFEGKVWKNKKDKYIDEVLAEVPSFEEWKDIKDDLATCDKDLNNVCEQKEELYEENTKLKDLLKECLPYISRSLTSRMIKNSAGYKKDVKLLTKINQVLGEKNNG